MAARLFAGIRRCPTIRRRPGSPIGPAPSSGAIPPRNSGARSAQRVPIQGTIYRRPDGGPWEFTIDGIYDSKLKGADKTQLIFNYQYLRETIPEPSGLRDRYNWYVFTIADPDRAPEIAAKIDAMFANSPSETKTNTEKAFVSDWAKQVGDIGKIMMWIVAMAMFTILLVAGNTMAQAIRERTNELAVLKTLGFGEGRILCHGAARIGASSRWLAADSAWRCPTRCITLAGDPTHGLLPAFYFPTRRWWSESHWCWRSARVRLPARAGRPVDCASSTR